MNYEQSDNDAAQEAAHHHDELQQERVERAIKNLESALLQYHLKRFYEEMEAQ